MNTDQLLDRVRTLPVIPRVLQELLISFSNPDISTRGLAQLISGDPALCAQLLRLANSARYHSPQAVNSAHQAVQLLGLTNVRSLVISIGLISCFAKLPEHLLSPFWQHSLRTAVLARHWAALAQIDGELAYTLSLLHGVGQLVMRLGLPEPMLALDAQAAPFAPQRLAVERAALSFNYAEVGAELARRWQFPELFVQVIGAAETRQDKPQACALADLIALASWQAWVTQEPLSPEQIDALWPTHLADKLGVSSQLGGSHFADWNELCGDLPELLSPSCV
jgi:HD-like signal output (HDOD) protein